MRRQPGGEIGITNLQIVLDDPEPIASAVDFLHSMFQAQIRKQAKLCMEAGTLTVSNGRPHLFTTSSL